MFDRERGVPRLGYGGAAHAGVAHETRKDSPMPVAGSDGYTMGLPKQIVAEAERVVRRARQSEGAGIGGDPHDSREDKRRESESRLALYNPVEPWLADRVMDAVAAERADQHVHIGQDHRKRRATYSRSSIS